MATREELEIEIGNLTSELNLSRAETKLARAETQRAEAQRDNIAEKHKRLTDEIAKKG